MRADIVPGTTFADYKLSDHTAKRRRLSELQGQNPMILVVSRGGFCPRTEGKRKGLWRSIASWKLGTAGW